MNTAPPIRFAAAVARCVDRLEIAGRATLTPERLVNLPPSAPAAAMVVGFLPANGMSWSELGMILRYLPEARVRGLADQLSQTGLIELNDTGIAFTSEGGECAQMVINQLPVALDDLWATDQDRTGHLAEIAGRVSTAATVTGSPSSLTIDGILRPATQSSSFKLWHALSTIRRHRADAHATAWTEAGHTAASIQQRPAYAQRKAIEDRTNEINAPIWASISETEQSQLITGLAGLNGIGNPT